MFLRVPKVFLRVIKVAVRAGLVKPLSICGVDFLHTLLEVILSIKDHYFCCELIIMGHLQLKTGIGAVEEWDGMFFCSSSMSSECRLYQTIGWPLLTLSQQMILLTSLVIMMLEMARFLVLTTTRMTSGACFVHITRHQSPPWTNSNSDSWHVFWLNCQNHVQIQIQVPNQDPYYNPLSIILQATAPMRVSWTYHECDVNYQALFSNPSPNQFSLKSKSS